MNILLQITAFVGVAMVAYALYGILSSGKANTNAETKPASCLPEGLVLKLKEQLLALESELEQLRADYASAKKIIEAAKLKESQWQQEVNRKEEWVAKSEEMLAKVRVENLELKNKFEAKEKELQEQFTKNVNLNKEVKELQEQLPVLEKENREKSDQLEASKHQMERQLNQMQAYQETAASLKKKEEESEWVPKQEFNRLNEEYEKLEKELAAKEGKLRVLVEDMIKLKAKLAEKGSFEEQKMPEEKVEPGPKKIGGQEPEDEKKNL